MMSMMLKSALLTVGLLLLAQQCRSLAIERCPNGWTRFDQSCFVLIKVKQSWAEAQMICEMLGGNLAHIRNWRESNGIGSMVAQARTHQAWIGLSDLVTEGHFKWTKPTREMTYTNFYRGEPNNGSGRNEHCGTIRFDGFWNDTECFNKLLFICQSSVQSQRSPEH